MRPLQKGEIRSAFALGYFTGANCPGSCASKDDFGARARGDMLGKGIIRIQNDRPISADSFDKGAFLLRDCLARSHKLNMRDADVCDHRHVRHSQARQHGDFSGMIHPNLPHGDFILGSRL